MIKEDYYTAAIREIDIRLEKGGNLYADLGNVAAVLRKRCEHFYWIGFYFLKCDQLILGPFQGTPACVFLALDSGVCAACVRDRRTIIVKDVRTFSGHIVCDPNSKSEIAVPCFNDRNRLKAVLDVDSDRLNAFDDVDQHYLETVVQRIRHGWNRKEQ